MTGLHDKKQLFTVSSMRHFGYWIERPSLLKYFDTHHLKVIIICQCSTFIIY